MSLVLDKMAGEKKSSFLADAAARVFLLAARFLFLRFLEILIKEKRVSIFAMQPFGRWGMA